MGGLYPMKQIPRQPGFPAEAQYAILSRDGSFTQGFYKLVEESYNDGTAAVVLYHKSDLPCWQPSYYRTLAELLKHDFPVVEIVG